MQSNGDKVKGTRTKYQKRRNDKTKKNFRIFGNKPSHEAAVLDPN